MWQFFVVVGVVFGALAGLIAFLMTYDEYSHHMLSRRRLLGESLQAAGATWLFFLVIALALGGAFFFMASRV